VPEAQTPTMTWRLTVHEKRGLNKQKLDLRFCRSAVLRFCGSAVLPFCRSAVLRFLRAKTRLNIVKRGVIVTAQACRPSLSKNEIFCENHLFPHIIIVKWIIMGCTT
jgi:hypothetical protein